MKKEFSVPRAETDTFSDWLSNIYTGVTDNSSSEYSSDSDDVSIRPTKTKDFSDGF